MSHPVPPPTDSDWSSFSALSWNLETRLMLGNCVDILYTLDTGVAMTSDEATYLIRVAHRLGEGAQDHAHGSHSVETVILGVMVTNTARDAFGTEPDVASSTLKELADALRETAERKTATSGQVSELTGRLIKLHSSLFDSGIERADEVVVLDRIA